jgi:hypothetical protein
MTPIVRTVEMENGNKVNFTTGEKWPYWRISFENGGIPAELSGLYTDFDKAYEAARRYIEGRAARNRTKFKGSVKEK